MSKGYRIEREPGGREVSVWEVSLLRRLVGVGIVCSVIMGVVCSIAWALQVPVWLQVIFYLLPSGLFVGFLVHYLRSENRGPSIRLSAEEMVLHAPNGMAEVVRRQEVAHLLMRCQDRGEDGSTAFYLVLHDGRRILLGGNWQQGCANLILRTKIIFGLRLLYESWDGSKLEHATWEPEAPDAKWRRDDSVWALVRLQWDMVAKAKQEQQAAKVARG